MKKTLNVIGLMSGTSFDGVDCVLCKINPDLSFEVLVSDIFNYPLLIKKEIFKLIKGDGTIAELCTLNTVLGDFYTECALKLCKNAGFDIKNVDLISSHGQTIFHNPTKEKFLNYTKNSTLQIGELSVIAKKTGVVTVGDFRPCDMALDGQGAPLVPFFDKAVFGNLNKNIAVQNLGGIANVTIIGKNGEFLAFDNGPANALIDLAMEKFYHKSYDKDGETGLSANYDKGLLNYICEIDDFINLKPPKSTGKEHYNQELLNKILSYGKFEPEIIISTLSAYTGYVISKSLNDFSPVKVEEIILSGGGAKNKAIIKYLKEFSGLKISHSEDYNIPDDFKEAIAFAILGYQRFYGKSNNEPKATGSTKQTSMGKIVLP